MEFVTSFFLFTYLLGMLIGIMFWLAWMFGVIEIKGLRNLPLWIKGGLLVISNHPSLVECVLLIGLFFFHYLLRPFRWGPWTVADAKTYFTGWKKVLGWLAGPRLIVVDRTEEAGNTKGLAQARSALKFGGIVFLYAEGGRSWKGDDHITSEKGQIIRRLNPGFTVLARTKGVQTLPLWVQWDGWYLTIVIGEPMIFTNGTPREEVVEIVQTTILRLGDTVASLREVA